MTTRNGPIIVNLKFNRLLNSLETPVQANLTPGGGERGALASLLVTFPPFFGMGRQQTTDLDWTEQASHRATLRFGMCQCLHRLISLALHHRQVLIEAQDGDASYNDREKSLQ